MIQINEIKLGLPSKTGTQLLVRPIINSTTDLSCSTYYEVQSELGENLACGNIEINEQEYANWAEDNSYIENLIIEKLGLTRKIK